MRQGFRPDNPRRPWHTDDEWNRLRERIEGAEVSRVTGRHARWPIAAAAALIAAAALAIGWHRTRRADDTPRVAMTAAGERIVIRLADSSIVTLGPASTARYVVNARRREVQLDGLGDFKVVHDDKRPFVVRAGNAVATDLGTEFVVRAYHRDSSAEVAVTEGSVSLGSVKSPVSIELQPGDVGTLTPAGVPTTIGGERAATRAAWVEGRLVFDDEPLSVVVDELNRWFAADVRIEGKSLSRRRVSAVYNSPSLTGVLDAIEATLGVRVERNGRVVVITAGAR